MPSSTVEKLNVIEVFYFQVLDSFVTSLSVSETWRETRENIDLLGLFRIIRRDFLNQVWTNENVALLFHGDDSFALA